MKRYNAILIGQHENMDSSVIRGYKEITVCGSTSQAAVDKAKSIAAKRGLKLEFLWPAPVY